MNKFKVGLLLDSLFLRTWQHHILDFLVKHPAFEIELIVLSDAKTHARSNSRNWIYKLFMRIDRKVFKTKTNLFALRPVPNLPESKVIHVTPKQGKNTDEILDADLLAIRQHNLDVIVRFGFRILKGEILSAARLGVWSLHHGDNQVNRGGPLILLLSIVIKPQRFGQASNYFVPH
jgi:hypothetical protein